MLAGAVLPLSYTVLLRHALTRGVHSSGKGDRGQSLGRCANFFEKAAGQSAAHAAFRAGRSDALADKGKGKGAICSHPSQTHVGHSVLT
jgi:hypothetical protein